MKICQNDFNTPPRTCKDHALHTRGQDVLRQAHAFEQGAGTQTQQFVHDGRVVDQEVTLAARGAVLVDQCDGGFGQFFGQFFGVANCRGRENELWAGPIKSRHAFQPPNDVGNMRAKDAAVGVQLINDDKL